MIHSESPWRDLAELIIAGDCAHLADAIRTLPAAEVPRVVSRLDAELQPRLLELLEPTEAAQLLAVIERSRAADVLRSLEPSRAAAILEELPSNEEADLLGQVGGDGAVAILAQLEADHADALRTLTAYPPDTAGGLMVTEFLAYPGRTRVREVFQDLRDNADHYARYHVQYLYVLGSGGRLAAVLRVRDLLLADPETRISELTPIRPTKVDHHADLNTVREVFDRVSFVGLPVVDGDQVMVGVVRRFHVEEALAGRNASQLRQSLGIVGGEEVRTMPVLRRSGRRLSWLSVNIGLNILAASVIVLYQDTLAQVIALAVFLPIISDMSGCSGNQAVAVSLRELSLGLVRPNEIARVWLNEVMVGLLNGLALGLLLGGAAWLWKGNPFLGLVVGSAMAVNTIVAVSIGGTIPLVLRRFGLDPALASGPILTTVTDMCGFFLVLGLATAMLSSIAT